MAYDRYDTRDERSRWRDERSEDRGWNRDNRFEGRGRDRDERGFFERAGDEIASWFGDDDADRRRRQDQTRDNPSQGFGGRDRDRDRWSSQDRDYGRERMSGNWRGDRDRFEDRGRDRDRDRGDRDESWYESRGLNERGGWSERDYNPSWRRELWGSGDRDRERDRSREPGRRYGSDRDRGGYRPMTGDYGRAEMGGGQRGFGDWSRDDDGQSEWGRDPYRSTSRAGTSDWTDRSRHEDPHYHSWRQRHMSDLDRDYDDYRRENQSRFEDDFSGWREKRQQKRGLLVQIREHMEVVGSDEKHVGTVDKVVGDRVILAKSDPESGGVHHSLSCSDIDRIEGDRLFLECSADKARERWRDESRGRALFERDDQGEMGPRSLDRSFSGTYR